MLSRIWKRPALLLSFQEKITHLWGERKCLLPLCPPVWLWPGNLLQGAIFIVLSCKGQVSWSGKSVGRSVPASPIAVEWKLSSLANSGKGSVYRQFSCLVTSHRFLSGLGSKGLFPSILDSNPALQWQTTCKDWAVSTAAYQRRADSLLLSALHAPGA